MFIDLKGVSSFYGSTPILHAIDLAVAKGRCLCVLGRNGVGKTTLIRTIMGLTTKVTGQISLGGTDVINTPTHERSLAGLGYIPQGREIIGNFTIEENILLGTFARRDGKRAVPDLCRKLFPYLAENLNRKAGQLSGGQQQQLAIARALATDPQILLLDEPTEGIQPNIVQEIEAMLFRLNKELGLTMILTEQHIKAARSLADEFVMMDRGRIVARGEISELTSEVIDRHLSI